MRVRAHTHTVEKTKASRENHQQSDATSREVCHSQDIKPQHLILTVVMTSITTEYDGPQAES